MHFGYVVNVIVYLMRLIKQRIMDPRVGGYNLFLGIINNHYNLSAYHWRRPDMNPTCLSLGTV